MGATAGSTGGRGAAGLAGRLAMALVGVAATVGWASTTAPSPAGATSAPAVTLRLVWRHVITDGASGVIALGSPAIATLTGGPAVVVGDRSGHVYALNLATGNDVAGWPKSVGAPVTSTPSVVTVPGTTHQTVLVGTGNAAVPCAGGYQWLSPDGAQQLVRATNPSTYPACAADGVQASMAVATLGGVTGAVAGSLGQMTYAMNTADRSVLPGFPWFQADSNFSTPAIADVEGNGTNQIIEGGASTAGVAYGQTYTNGGHVRILSASGSLLCEDTTNESINSSPAVGRFLAGTAIGIVAGTGPTYPAASQHDQVIALDTSCRQVWARTLAGTTGYESPALADVLGNGQLQVLVTTRSGIVYALDGANGSVIWQRQLAHEIFGSPVTVALGTGHQDVVIATINGFDVLTGQSGTVLVGTVTTTTGFENAPLVTRDPNGSIGITVAGYQPNDSVVSHYEIATSNGAHVDGPGAWPQFHHDPQLTGNANAPIVKPAPPFATFTRIAGQTADATAVQELEDRFDASAGQCPGTASTRPVVLATDATYPDALASAPLARSLATGIVLTPPGALSSVTAGALRTEGITKVVVVGGPLAVSTTVLHTLASTPASACGGGPGTGADLVVTRIFGATQYDTAAQIAQSPTVRADVGALDLSGAYQGTNPTGGAGRWNTTAGNASGAPGATGALRTAVLATGTGFQDAEAASTLAYAAHLPVLLSTPEALSTQAQDAIAALGVTQVLVMGGPLALSDAVVTTLESLGVSVLRVAGHDAGATAVELATLESAAAPQGLAWHGTGDLTIAQGTYFSDGLAGAVVAADGPTSALPEPLLLTQSPSVVGTALAAFLHTAGTTGLGGVRVSHLTVLGGTLAVTQTAVDQMGADL